jgi:hypothetical protein
MFKVVARPQGRSIGHVFGFALPSERMWLTSSARDSRMALALVDDSTQEW